MTPQQFLETRAAKVLDEMPKLSAAQLRALLGDEREMEALDFRDRDDLIVKGLARRVAPTEQHPYWRTWITISGLMLRAMFDKGGEG